LQRTHHLAVHRDALGRKRFAVIALFVVMAVLALLWAWLVYVIVIEPVRLFLGIRHERKLVTQLPGDHRGDDWALKRRPPVAN
jgi:hypothetical protein